MSWKLSLRLGASMLVVAITAVGAATPAPAPAPESTLQEQINRAQRLLMPMPSWNRDPSLVQQMRGRSGSDYVVALLSGNRGGTESLQILALLERQVFGDYELKSFLPFAGRSDDMLIHKVLPDVRYTGTEMRFIVEGRDDRPESRTRGQTIRRTFRIDENGALAVVESDVNSR
ncbi:hypothetical protein ACQ86G_19265 [Roseateles chitinivorans]|uniref:hypothetical protein n=1 Tax=Roseateles chitinivorans TaxID=2917965 RepID=UPI003D663F9B